MTEKYFSIIAKELGIRDAQISATSALLQEGATVPFIARYRKEATGSLDEVAVTSIRDRLEQLFELDKRREAVLRSLDERGLLSDEIRCRVEEASSMTELEDIYLPFRPKRRTRAMAAKEKGLEPLAGMIFAQGGMDPEHEAASYVDPDKGVTSVDDALAGARDIIAEWVSEDQHARERMRELYTLKGVLRSKVLPGKEEEGIKYRDYYDWEEPLSGAPSHRVLAIRRGEKEGFLSLRIMPHDDEAIAILESIFIRDSLPAALQVKEAIRDSYKRLLSLSIESEMRLSSKKSADERAIRVFAENLRQLLLSPPLGRKSVLAIDPGFRTGCKVVCLDRQGKLLMSDTIYPHFSEKGSSEAGTRIRELYSRFGIEVIAIGNGTAGRETETFVRSLDLPGSIAVVMVNESGASVYSASDAAREEFPDQDVTVRGSVSIGRRLMDPLAELVKIDPKSIGVGQYQHDVDQPSLKRSLDDVVVSCVNAVGVEVNTASRQLLTYVSGLGPQLAGNIIEFRNGNGPLRSRKELRKVPRLGPKAFEQAAGFLRIRDGENPLDGSAVHPESYHIVDQMASDLGCSVSDLMREDGLRKSIDLSRYVTDSVGIPTLTDIISELARPGRDPREQYEAFAFADGIEKIEDVRPGMRLPGIVTNITAFGVFVDIGVHQDGLIHISELSDRFIKEAGEIVKVHQKVVVTVLDVDLQRRRIALSMKSPGGKTRTLPDRPEKKQTKGKESAGGKANNKTSRFANNPFLEALKNR